MILFIKASNLKKRLNRQGRVLQALLDENDLNLSDIEGREIQSYEETEGGEYEPEATKEEVADQFRELAGQKDASVTKPQMSLEDFFTKQFFTVLGIISLLLALGFFLAWSFSSGIIGPAGRVAIGVLVSLIALGLGEGLRNKYPTIFPVLSSIGIVGLMITTFFARHFYGFITPLQSFGVYVVVVGTGILLALRYQSRLLANFSVLGGLLAPILIGTNLDQYGLLVYLAILTMAGFWVSYRQQWPEIGVVLLVGVAALENKILGYSRPRCVFIPGGDPCPSKTGWVTGNAWPFLAFVYAMHLLLASGGVIRMVREKVQQKITDPFTSQSALEMLVFVVSILLANAIGYQVFDMLEWEHFGFFVLLQGFLYFFFSEYLKKQGLELFQKISLGATMVSILFATGWEIPNNQEFMKSLAFLAEAILFAAVGLSLKDKGFMIFARIALLLGAGVMLDGAIGNLSAGILVGFYFVGLMITLKDFEKTWEKVVGIIGYVIGVILLFVWNGDALYGFLPKDAKAPLFILPMVLALLTAFGKIIPHFSVSRILGQIVIGITTLMFWMTAGRLGDTPMELLGLLLVLGGIFGVLAACFWEHKEKQLSEGYKVFAVYFALALGTLTILRWSFDILKEPVLTMALLIWGGLLMGLGIKNNWQRFRYFGIGMFLFLIAKLYLLDVWQWSIPVRFGAFLMLGIALLAISFSSQKFLNKK